MFFQSVTYKMSYFVSCLHGRKKLEAIRNFFSPACSFYFVGIANLRKHILHKMKTRLSLYSAACGNHRKPRGCCVTHSFTLGFTTRCLQNATEKSYSNKAIQACNSVQYFLQISLKSSHFFFLEKYQETCVCEN